MARRTSLGAAGRAATWIAPTTTVAQRDRSIPTGSVLELRMNTKLSSKTSRAGDRFTATVLRPLVVDGDRIVPDGATGWHTVSFDVK